MIRFMMGLIRAASRRWQLMAAIAGAVFGAGIVSLIIAGLMTPDLVPATRNAKIVVSGITGQGLREGRTSWRFASSRSEFSVDGAVQTYQNTTATYYLRGRPTYRIVAGEITLDTRSMNYSADKGVRVWSVGLPEKQHFIAQTLIWNNATQTLICPGDTDLLYHGVAIHTNHLAANLVTGTVTTGQSIANVGQSSPTRPSTNR